MAYIKVYISCQGLSRVEMAKVMAAEVHLQKAINDPSFKEFVLNYKWKYSYSIGYLWWRRKHSVTHFSFSSVGEMTNQEVFNRIEKGAEMLNPEGPLNEVNIFLKVNRRNRRGVIGYTYPSTKWQWIYNWFFKKASVEQVAGNLMHEWLHKIGFKHDYKRTQRRKYSVPYAVGYWVSRYISKEQ